MGFPIIIFISILGVRITKDTKKLDNVMYNDDIVLEHIDRKNRAKCGEGPKIE